MTLIVHKAEMGQGVYTSMPMLLAEELEVDLARVQLEPAPADDALYADPLLGEQTTGNSTAVRGAWEPLRRAGASARVMLVSAAAQTWKVDASSCRAERGAVLHVPTGRTLSYGALAEAASKLPVPQSVTLKDPKDWKLIGTPAKRLDTPDKVNGKAQFGIDVKVPGMKIATVAACPVFGGKLASVDDSKAKALPGVRQVVRLDDAVAVVADHMWAAKQGLAALDIHWDEGPNAAIGTADIVSQLEAASQKPGVVARKEGDVESAMAGAAQKLEAVYQQPFLAHATMEPMNCTVHVRKDGCDVWVGTQVQTRARATAAEVTGLPIEKVVVHNHLLGGGFGRRLEVDFITQAAEIAKQVDGPVKVVWTREEDMQHDMYRPYYYDRIRAGLDAQGMPIAWSHRITGSSIMARFFPAWFKNGLDPDAVDGAAEPPYAFPNILVDYVRQEPPGIRTAFWRGVGPTNNLFVVESFLDELAAAAKKDPVEYRRALLAKSPRARAVARARRREGRLGSAASGGPGSRDRAAPHLRRDLPRAGGGGVGLAGGRRARPPRRRGRGLRGGRESGHGRGADGRRNRVRTQRRPLRRDHTQEWPRRAEQLPRLPGPADQRGARHRGASREEHRGTRRHGGAADVVCIPGAGQRHLRRDRETPAQAPGRPRAAGRPVEVMRARSEMRA